MASPRSQFGGAKIGAKGEYAFMGLDKEKPTEPFRIFPAMHSLAAEDVWMLYLAQHYGFKGLSQDKTKQVPRPFLCIEEKNFNTKMIEVSCPECRYYERREKMIEDRKARFGHGDHLVQIWVSIAKDMRARMESAPSVAETELQRRIDGAIRSKTALGYNNGDMRGIAEELIGRWPVVKQALERFGAEIEKEKS